jgi:hypothetical protein
MTGWLADWLLDAIYPSFQLISQITYTPNYKL